MQVVAPARWKKSWGRTFMTYINPREGRPVHAAVPLAGRDQVGAAIHARGNFHLELLLFPDPAFPVTVGADLSHKLLHALAARTGGGHLKDTVAAGHHAPAITLGAWGPLGPGFSAAAAAGGAAHQPGAPPRSPRFPTPRPGNQASDRTGDRCPPEPGARHHRSRPPKPKTSPKMSLKERKMSEKSENPVNPEDDRPSWPYVS